MKVLLVSLRDPFLDSDRVMPPLGVMSIHSFLLHCGIDSTITNDVSREDLSKYTHIGISCMTPQRDQALDVLRKAKAINKDSIVFIGGPHARTYLDDCMDFDHIVIGDGEYSSVKIVYGAKDKVIDDEVQELSSLPLPYRERDFLNQYCYNIQGLKATTILTAKGCPNKCAFCEDAGTKVRLYSASNVGKQIDQCIDAGFESIMFFDDLFTLSLNRVVALAEEIKKRSIPYRCFGHARFMTLAMSKVLEKSGCIEIGVGVESGSQKILDGIDKRTTVSQNKEFVYMMNRLGIRVKAFMILGLPGEDSSSIKETEKFIEFLVSKQFTSRLGKKVTNDFDLTIFYPYKGTRVRDNINEYDIRIHDDNELGVYKGIGGRSDCVVSTSSLSREDIAREQERILSRWKKEVA